MITPAAQPSPHTPPPTGRRPDEADERGAPLLEALVAGPAARAAPSRLRLPAGLLPPARVAFGLLLAAIAAAIVGARLGLPVGWVRLADNLHWSIADIAAACFAWAGVREARGRGRRDEADARRWFAFGFTSYALGQMLWNVQVFAGWQPFPAPSDPLFMLLAPCCAVGMLGFLRGRVGGAPLLAAVIDTASLAIAVVAVALVDYLPLRGGTSALALGVMIAYPTLLFAAACIGLMMMALLRAGATWSPWVLIAQLGVQGALWMQWNALSLHGALADGRALNAVFSVFTFAGGLAAAGWCIDRQAGARVDRFYEGALRMLPLVVVVGVTFAVTLQASIASLSPAAHFACEAAAVVVIVLAAARQTLMLRDRDQLAEAQRQLREREDELRELNRTLEQRVLERTLEAETRNSELTAALQQLSAVRDELVRSAKLAGLGALASGVAEEVALALGNAGMLAATTAAPTESHRQLEHALAEAQRVIAGLQQIAADQTTGRRRRFDLLAAVRELAGLIRLAHRHGPIEILVTGEPGLELDSYPGPVGQVLAQLVDNAIAHGFAGGRAGTIALDVRAEGRDHARLSVRDDGDGIPPGALPQVFAPFFTTRAAGSRAGLGLTVSRTLVTGILGGRIDVASAAGTGTTVTITLPRRAPEA